jgi:hypothetical protein
MEQRRRQRPRMGNHGRLAQAYGSQGRARHVPDQVVGQGSSRPLTDRPTSLPTWVAARSARGRGTLIRKRSVVQVHVAPPVLRTPVQRREPNGEPAGHADLAPFCGTAPTSTCRLERSISPTTRGWPASSALDRRPGTGVTAMSSWCRPSASRRSDSFSFGWRPTRPQPGSASASTSAATSSAALPWVRYRHSDKEEVRGSSPRSPTSQYVIRVRPCLGFAGAIKG